MTPIHNSELPIAILETLPNPVLVKDSELRYVWVNSAFENLFGVCLDDLEGRTDAEMFKERQAVQCTGGDLRVLDKDEVDESYETIFAPDGAEIETITRKSRLALSDGSVFLVGVLHDVTEVVRSNEKLQESEKKLKLQSMQLLALANTDPLTNCLNRRALFEKVTRSNDNPSGKYALMALDLDFFKKINDEYGHHAGDAALVHFSDLVRTVIRENDIFARIGGEEFAIVLPDVKPHVANLIAERICGLLAESPLLHEDREIPMTVSIGVSTCSSDTSAVFTDVMKNADDALYQAKERGRNQYANLAEAA